MKKLLSLMLMLALLVLVTSNATAQEPVGGGEEVEDATEEVVEEVEESVGEPVEEPVSEDAGEAVEEAVEEEVEGVGETVSEPVDDNGEAVEEFEPVGDPGELSAAQLDDSEQDINAQLASGWVSVFQIINGGTGEANVTVSYYQEGETAADATTTEAIASGAVLRISADSVAGLADNWRGAVTIESSEPVAVAVNQMITSGDTKYAGAYTGLDGGSATWYIPAIWQNYFDWNQSLAVQGVSGSNIAFTITVYDGQGNVAHTENGTVGLNSMAYYDISTWPLTNDGGRFNGSATVTTDNGTDEVAVVTVAENPGGNTQSYEGFTSGAPTLYVAGLYSNYFSWGSSINVQNISDVDGCQVSITYSDGLNAEFTLDSKIAREVFQPTEGHANGERWLGSGTITTNTAGCELVAVVNASNATSQAQTYSAVSAGATKVGLPLLQRKDNGTRDSSFTVQNVSSSTANVTVRFSNGNTATANLTAVGTDGASQEFFLPTVSQVTDGFGGGAIVESDQGVAVIVNQTNTDTSGGDWSMSYNGVPLQ